MTDFIKSDQLRGARIRGCSLNGARISLCDLEGVVIRGSNVAGLEIDDPWLIESGATLTVNGIDVTPYVDAELNKRFPGRELRTATTLKGTREAFAALEEAWHAAIARATAMPVGSVDEKIDGEWSFAETLRHVVMAIDMWLQRGIFGIQQPFDPIGVPNVEHEEDGEDMSVFSTAKPEWEHVVRTWQDRMDMVEHFLRDTSAAQLKEKRPDPHNPAHEVAVHSCIGTILEEGWEHLRYATRDLDVLAARPA